MTKLQIVSKQYIQSPIRFWYILSLVSYGTGHFQIFHPWTGNFSETYHVPHVWKYPTFPSVVVSNVPLSSDTMLWKFPSLIYLTPSYDLDLFLYMSVMWNWFLVLCQSSVGLLIWGLAVLSLTFERAFKSSTVLIELFILPSLSVSISCVEVWLLSLGE